MNACLLCWGYIRIILGRGYIRVILGLYKGYIGLCGVTLGPFRDNGK